MNSKKFVVVYENENVGVDSIWGYNGSISLSESFWRDANEVRKNK